MILLISFLLIVPAVLACKSVGMTLPGTGVVKFNQIPIDPSVNLGTGRAAYVTQNTPKPLYLYHTYDNTTGQGTWRINDKLHAPHEALTFANSWAVTPCLINQAISGDKPPYWRVHNGAAWTPDSTVTTTHVGPDGTIFLENIDPNFTGFYVEREVVESETYEGNVYVRIKSTEDEPTRFLSQVDTPKGPIWMIGQQYGKDAGWMYVRSSAVTAKAITETTWQRLTSDQGWQDSEVSVYSAASKQLGTSGASGDVYSAMRYGRSVKSVPSGQRYFFLRNRLPMPAVGLGTGGVWPETAYQNIKSALTIGYRLLDLAREYKNEYIVGNLFRDTKKDSSVPDRSSVFLETKVWPTDLGFRPTTEAIKRSLTELGTSYVDLYLLHWPKCEPHISWMHCETTVEPTATWRESWRAMEKAYAEGLVLSIGVSNFNLDLLNEMEDRISTVLPHVVQNFAAPGNMDEAVRQWCMEHSTVYQPYANLRNLNSLNPQYLQLLDQLANKYQVSVHGVMLRFFFQTGTAVIPRSIKEDHLRENLKVTQWSLTDDEMMQLGWNRISV